MEMEQDKAEMVEMREPKPNQLQRMSSRDRSLVRLKQILTLLGGFIVCLSFGSGEEIVDNIQTGF